jgi:hypothetical protein
LHDRFPFDNAGASDLNWIQLSALLQLDGRSGDEEVGGVGVIN